MAHDLRIVGFEDDLRQAVAVAEIDEDLIAVRAKGIHPAIEDDGLSDMRFAQFAAGVCPLPVGHGRSTFLCP